MRQHDAIARVVSARHAVNPVAIALAVVAGAAAATTVIWLRIAHDSDESAGETWWVVAWLVVGAVNLVAGTMLTSRFGHRRLGACLLVVGGAALILAVSTQASFVTDANPASGWARFDEARTWAQPIATGVLAALLPWEFAWSGRSRVIELVWWSTAATIGVLAIAAVTVGERPGFDLVDLMTTMVALSATAATARVMACWWRRRDASDDPLLGWLAAGAAVAWAAVVPEALEFGFEVPGGDVAGSLLLLATVPLLLVGAIVNALRRRPIRIRGLTREVLGWVVMAGAIVIVYTGTVAGFGRLVGGDGPTWLLVAATGAIAVAAEPIRRRIQRSVDRLVWGARDDPLHMVRQVVGHVGSDSRDELLPALVVGLQRDLRLDAVAIDVRTADGWRREASIGPATRHQRVIELVQRDEVVGRLVVGWETGPSLRPRDELVLGELAGPLALAVGWVQLAGQLRRSSVEIVSAREEERRRIRRDLHDGLGPSLTGVSLGVRTAMRQLARSDADGSLGQTRQLLERAADEIDSLVDEVKRIVRDLRPTALDQLGLVEAVAEFARTFDGELEIELSLPETPLELPAAVEVATYRIITEAVTNVVRHAQAVRCWLSISGGPTVGIDVVDDGIGVLDDNAAGIGWTAMRERATELGGSFLVTQHRPHGTHVHVELPAVLP